MHFPAPGPNLGFDAPASASGQQCVSAWTVGGTPKEIVDPLEQRVRDKVRKREMLAERAQTDFREWMEASGIEGPVGGPVEAPAQAALP